MYSPELVRISSWLALQEELVELFIFRFDRKPLSLGTFNLKHVSSRVSLLTAWAISFSQDVPDPRSGFNSVGVDLSETPMARVKKSTANYPRTNKAGTKC
jgi:hypothetical protein